MRQYQKPQNSEEYQQNFSPLKSALSETEALLESSRCLFCYDAPCVKACPTGIDIPLFIKQINSQNTRGAARTIYKSNWLGKACGQVCPTEVLCEGSCVYVEEGSPAVEIGRLQSYACDHVIKEDISWSKNAADTSKSVGIIGAGPAGISAACELIQAGVEVVIYEAAPEWGGLNRYGVAPYKWSNEESDEELKWLQKQFPFEVEFNQVITENDLSELFEKHQAILLATGLNKSRGLNAGDTEVDGVISAIDFIADLRNQRQDLSLGSKVVVLGGGNTAMDAANEAARMGSEVALMYRKDADQMSAYDFESELAQASGVQFIFNSSISQVFSENGKLISINFTEDGVEKNLPCDQLIYAIGQFAEAPFPSEDPRIFMAGDLSNGGAEVVHAVADAKVKANQILDFLEIKSLA
jgi:glutamate synthase (NADPH/NADH) small chain